MGRKQPGRCPPGRPSGPRGWRGPPQGGPSRGRLDAGQAQGGADRDGIGFLGRPRASGEPQAENQHEGQESPVLRLSLHVFFSFGNLRLFAFFFRRLSTELGYRDKTGDRASGANGTARSGAGTWLSSDSAEKPNVVRLTRIHDMLSYTHGGVNEMG